MSQTDAHAAVLREVSSLAERAIELSLQIHSDPEVAFEEHHACERLTDWLQAEGFDVERNVAGLETAFIGSWGHGLPRLAYLLEYDALPGLGHACGHNLIAAGGITAATALARVLGDRSVGSVLVIGTPAEEGGGGKIIELNHGVFDGVDVALMFHPQDRTVPWRSSLVCLHYRVKFHGVASHAARNPEDGRNALAAMIQFFVAIDGLRQHIDRTARIHGIITNGGAAANVVPDLTEARLYVRHPTTAMALALSERVEDCARAAALATGTTCEIDQPGPMYGERKHNAVLSRRVARYLSEGGLEVATPSAGDPAGSSDIGNVSERIPCLHAYVQVGPNGTPGHSEAMRAAACSDQGHRAMLTAAGALARLGADVMLDPPFLAAVKDAFVGNELLDS